MSDVLSTKRPSYRLVDEKDRPITGRFYEYEITPVNLSRYRVNVVGRKKIRGSDWIKLKYKGYDKDFDEWIKESESDIIDL